MQMSRKIIIAVGLIVIIPFLAFYYLSEFFAEFAFITKGWIVVIAVLIGALGVIYLTKFVNLLTRLYRNLTTIAEGNFNQEVKVGKSDGAESLALSISQVSKKLRQNADELEERAILIERSTNELERMNSIKTDYLSNVAHELRTPLINIDKSSIFLLEGSDTLPNTERDNFLKTINSNARRLTHLVNELLDISKIEAGEMTMQYKFIDINDLIHEAVDSVEQWIQSKELELEFKIASSLPKVYIDKDRIIQVIINLLSNAIKFTPAKGRIMVEAAIFNNTLGEIISTEKSGRLIMIAVKDTGPGIAEAQKNMLFVRYKFQEEVGSYNKLPSTGLGLPIAKDIVQMHGGKIWVESQPGDGSRFVFTIPLGVKPVESTTKTCFQVPPKRILIIDDENSVRELLSRELNKKGHFVDTAEDGFEGFKKALESCYDLVITDVRMPNMDGLICIKSLQKLNSNIIFVVISGFSIEGELDEIVKRHSYPCIKKPFDLPDLLKTIEEKLMVQSQK